MFFPVRTDRRLRSTPWLNYALVAANVLVFAGVQPSVPAQWLAQNLWLHPPDSPYHRLWQFLSYQFLHADWLHLLGNMLFLYIFGNAVEDRLGKVGYLLFYLAGGVFAGVGHVLTSNAPVLGASGSVAGVSGAFLALCPLVGVTIVYWFIIIGAFEVSALVLILFNFARDALMWMMGMGQVAYLAHIAGYLYGFAIGMGLLLTRLLPRERYDMLALIERRKKRREFQSLQKKGWSPWESSESPGKPGEPAAPLTDRERDLLSRRAEISALVNDHRYREAVTRYHALLDVYPDQAMPQQQQLDLANHMMAEGGYEDAAAAYELFLTTYPAYSDRHQVQLILGLIYGRYIKRPDRARELLNTAMPRLQGQDRQLAEQVLAEAG